MMGCEVEDNRWVVGNAPALGAVEDLLDRQARLAGPVKLVAPAVWRAEMPLCVIAASAVVAAALDAATSAHGGGPGLGAVPVDAAGGSGTDAIPSAAFSGGLAWEQAGPSLVLRRTAPGINHEITATLTGACVLFRSPLLRRRIPDSGRDVLTHFLVGLNGRIRLARASRTETGIYLEVSLPADILESSLVEEAVHALSAGFRLARRECSCLMDGQVERQYRQFHLVKGVMS